MEDFLREREEYLRQQEQKALKGKEKKNAEKAPRVTIGGKSYRLDSFRFKSKAERSELLEHWFLERYEDPANSAPYESASISGAVLMMR